MYQTKEMNVDLSIKAKGIANRINSEINNVFNQSDFVSLERKETSIFIKIIREKNLYEFILQKDYPYKPPISIKYNNREYRKSLYNYSEKVQKILKKRYFLDCFCCNTILSGCNWTPACNISHIINEMDRITKIQKEIIIVILCDEIRYKNKCCFAEFEKYLIG
jgi:hypothetical protein